MHFRAVAVDDDPSCLSTSLLELKKNPEEIGRAHV